MRFLVTIALLISLVFSQAGLVVVDRCPCLESGKGLTDCHCCSGAVVTGRTCCAESDSADKRAPRVPDVPEKTVVDGCHCGELTRDTPQPAQAEQRHEILLGIFLPVPVEVAEVEPALACAVLICCHSRMMPPGIPRRIHYCSFRL